MKSYSGNPAFSTQKNLEDTEQQLDEVNFANTRLQADHPVNQRSCFLAASIR